MDTEEDEKKVDGLSYDSTTTAAAEMSSEAETTTPPTTTETGFDPTARASLLLRHLQSQPYHRRIRAGQQRTPDNDDDVMDDDETQNAAASAALAANRRGGASSKSDGFSVTTWDSEEEARLAQQEWEESIAQLNLALQVMALPFLGKWLGRKWSYWAFSRFQRHGFTAAFFGMEWVWAPMTVVPSAAVAAVQP